jgi:sensor domain CHASE-containing protein
VEAVWVPLAVALIGGPVMWFLTRFDRRNTDQHAQNQAVLTRIESKIEKVDDRLNDHITWHIDQK